MDIRKIYNTQNFNGLNYSRVSGKGLKLVIKDLPQLEELGKKYDIKLWSRFSDILNTEFINIDVNPLNKKLDFCTEYLPIGGNLTVKLIANLWSMP